MKEISPVFFLIPGRHVSVSNDAPFIGHGARGGEAQRTDAAVRHQGRSKPWVKKKFGSNTGDLSEFSQYRRFIGFFPNTGGLSELTLTIQGLIFDEPTVFWYFGR